MKKMIIFDLSGTLVRMRPPTLLVKRSYIEELSSKFYLGIITGAKRSETLNILRILNIASFFRLIITADDSKFRKPNPDLFPRRLVNVYIGDTKNDEVFSANGKVPFIRVNKKYNIDMVIKNLLK
jgi:phosphoglycolate phosphatase-like HAD superfamily hydrolase